MNQKLLSWIVLLSLPGVALAQTEAENKHRHQHRHGHEQAAPTTPAAAPVSLAARTVVVANADEYEHVMSDMHKLLRSIGQINGALALSDWTTVARVASALTPEKTMGSQDPAAISFHAKIPAGWSSFGAPMHQGFARIAAEATGERRIASVLTILSETTTQCAGCHARFQIQLAPAR